MKPTIVKYFHDVDTHHDLMVEVESRESLFRFRLIVSFGGVRLVESTVKTSGWIYVVMPSGVSWILFDEPFETLPAFTPFRLTPTMDMTA